MINNGENNYNKKKWIGWESWENPRRAVPVSAPVDTHLLVAISKHEHHSPTHSLHPTLKPVDTQIIMWRGPCTYMEPEITYRNGRDESYLVKTPSLFGHSGPENKNYIPVLEGTLGLKLWNGREKKKEKKKELNKIKKINENVTLPSKRRWRSTKLIANQLTLRQNNILSSFRVHVTDLKLKDRSLGRNDSNIWIIAVVISEGNWE